MAQVTQKKARNRINLPLMLQLVTSLQILLTLFYLSIGVAWISGSEKHKSVITTGSDSYRFFDASQERVRHRVWFRPFNDNYMHHNRTVTGETIPGPFLDDHVFLIGARLSISFQPSNTDVHVDVFGFPGDWLVEGAVKEWCNLKRSPKQYKFITNAQFFANRAALYCQLECLDVHDSSNESLLCGPPIRMTLVPLHSGDINQDETTLIWRCNVSQHLSKSHLFEREALKKHMSVRVRLDLQVSHSSKRPSMHYITTFDIPLHTGVIGHGGPQVRSKEKGYFSMPQVQGKGAESSSDVGLCLAIYGSEAHRYLPEFVQHHMNVGISQVVVGIETSMDSELLHLAEASLRPFIDEGFVVLQSTGLDSFFTCESDMGKLHFYHQCLYHFKGLSKYAATWDLDEYWLPPLRLEVSGRSQFNFEVRGLDMEAQSHPDKEEKSLIRESNSHTQMHFIEKSKRSSFSDLTTKDPIWQGSNYARSISIRDVMNGVEMFYKQHGCDNQWCYHLIPSSYSYMKDNVTRTHRIRDDFHHRTSKVIESYKKAILKTEFAMMGGIHVPGSCEFPSDPEFYSFGKDKKCYPHIWPSGEFGRMHHYQSLMQFRDNLAVVHKEDLVEDEYLVSFAETVYNQLDALYMRTIKASLN